ncbi:MAG TPA: hypothetical protein PLV08_15545 [Flavobacteriales bacterium]|jgi:hypothetical protein|nr:hypothetical protein [Flavobacteriales bacterium]MBK7100405.1 hypothetical protein [Flavobacteriales bacterium]MBK7111100.1 hypothetical protein [Flavobacteriales bacterium]MBK7481159.1 hypothetical protein [Flavobacteriales bacterium]MBK7617951.1 hypothetical protein [Flavobacteriales bacterium]
MRIALLLLCTSIPFVHHAQDRDLELIRNGGFEFLQKPANTYDQLNQAIGWRDANLGLADLFSPTASPKTVGIPTNDYGTMAPFEGEYYAGFVGWKDDVQRNYSAYDENDMFIPAWGAYSEYLKGELIQPLKEDSTYELVFHVALAGNSDRSIMGVGAYISKLDLFYQNRKFMEEDPQVYRTKIITEREKWVEIRDTFVADGKEQFIYIGVFPYVGLESKSMVEGPDNRYAYYYIDGISLKQVASEK